MKVLKQLEIEDTYIAHQLKLLRLSTDKKIAEIAEATGYAQSYISLIENGKRNLNYKTLRRILLYGFGETLSSFFAKILEEEDQANKTKIYKTPFKLYDEDKTTSIEILIPTDASRGIEIVKLHLPPRSSFEEEFKVDFKVYGTVLNGIVEIQDFNQRVKIFQGESFSFFFQLVDSLEQSSFKIFNISEDRADLILIFTPPVL